MAADRFPIPFGLIFALLVVSAPEADADWPRWRGPANTGSIESGDYPTEISQSTIRWQTLLPGKGCSTPIVVDGTIYVTAPVAGEDALLAFSEDGKEQWSVSFGKEDPGKHRNGSGCNASPVSDGDAVFVYFKSGTLAAVETDGKIRWQTNLVQRFGKENLFWDHGTSPVLTTDSVVFARMHKGDSWVAAFDKASGDMTWKVDRTYDTPVECDHGYATPIVMNHDGKEAVLVWGAEHITVHDAASGEVLWSCGGFNPDANKLWPSIAMPVLFGDMAVIAYGRNDRKIPRLHGVRLGAGEEDAHVWMRDDVGTFVPSPVGYRGKLYLVRDRGEVECVDPATGETVWSDRFPKSRSNFYASPLIAGGLMYAPREDGVVFIARIDNGKLELLSENDLEQPVIGSPVPHKNEILLRGQDQLISVSDDSAKENVASGGKHLFILSGQSNMQGLRPAESFTPAVESAYGKENVIVVHDALGGQPIRRWYKDWQPESGDAPENTGDLHDRLMKKVATATEGQTIQSVTFLWMQGERDAKEGHGNVYGKSLAGLCDQLSGDLGRDDVNVVIGRLSDFDMDNKRYQHWTIVREAQVAFASEHPRGAWVDTDDLNDGLNRRGKEISNDLHYSAEGYKTFGSRLAEQAITLIDR